MSRRELRRQLIQAIEAVDLTRVRELVACDASIVNAPNSHQNVPLGDAIATGSVELVELLITNGANPHHRNHGGHSLLDTAAFSCRKEMAQYLISQGVDPTVHHAAAIGDISVLEQMVNSDATLLRPTRVGGRWKMTPLHAAVLGGSVAAFEYLLETNISVNAQNHNGHTALGLVTDCQSRELRIPMARLLLSHGADVDSRAGHHGGTVLHRAVMDGDDALAGLLLDDGADPNLQDWSGKTPLHHAVTKNRRLVEMLLKFSPDIDVTSRDGETSLQLAQRLGKKAIARFLTRTE